MNGEELVKFHKDTLESLNGMLKKKNHDYGGGRDEDAFSNFKMVEGFGVTSAEIGLFTRITDKLARLSTFIKKGKLQNESALDACDDLANYAIILKALIFDRMAGRNKPNILVPVDNASNITG